jgi:hypothetical protein
METDQLYGLPLDRFVPERAALAKELRAAGDRAGASEVAAMRKPSIAAWAVNQLVRTQSRAVKELFAAGDALSGAQENLIAGRGDARSLRDANARERSAVDALLALARGLLTGEGHELSPAILDRVSDTLHAAALDDGARDAIRDGRLERELQHVGLGALATVSAPATPAAPAVPKARTERHTEDRRAARIAEADARRRAEVAERAVRAAEQRREVAARTLKEAEEALARAHAESAEAEQAHQRAKDEL